MVKQQGLKKRTPKTITSISKLIADLEHVKQSGYAVDDEENSLGARCLGAPIFDAMGNVAAALGASGTLTQTDEADMPRIIEALKETVRRISRQFAAERSNGGCVASGPFALEGLFSFARDDQIVLHRKYVGNPVRAQARKILVRLVVHHAL